MGRESEKVPTVCWSLGVGVIEIEVGTVFEAWWNKSGREEGNTGG